MANERASSTYRGNNYDANHDWSIRPIYGDVAADAHLIEHFDHETNEISFRCIKDDISNMAHTMSVVTCEDNDLLYKYLIDAIKWNRRNSEPYSACWDEAVKYFPNDSHDPGNNSIETLFKFMTLNGGPFTFPVAKSRDNKSWNNTPQWRDKPAWNSHGQSQGRSWSSNNWVPKQGQGEWLTYPCNKAQERADLASALRESASNGPHPAAGVVCVPATVQPDTPPTGSYST